MHQPSALNHQDYFNSIRSLPGLENTYYYSLPALQAQGYSKIGRMPICLRIILESVLRNCDNQRIRQEDVVTLANWDAKKPSEDEIPFVVARIILQDFTGVPLLVDLAAMRDAVASLGQDQAL